MGEGGNCFNAVTLVTAGVGNGLSKFDLEIVTETVRTMVPGAISTARAFS